MTVAHASFDWLAAFVVIGVFLVAFFDLGEGRVILPAFLLFLVARGGYAEGIITLYDSIL